MATGQVTAQAFQQGADLIASLTGGVYGFCIKRCTIVGPSGSTAFAYVGSISPSGQFDSTRTGNLDTGEYPNAVDVPPGANVFVVWPGVSGNAYATFTVGDREQ